MTFIEFLNFLAMYVIASITIRAAQILGRNTWLAPALGVVHA